MPSWLVVLIDLFKSLMLGMALTCTYSKRDWKPEITERETATTAKSDRASKENASDKRCVIVIRTLVLLVNEAKRGYRRRF
jgi:hypothetical protein